MEIRGLHSGFLQSFERRADAPALAFADRTITYGGLHDAASRLAARLQAEGLGRNSRVGLLVDRGESLYSLVLGTLFAGAAYVPLDPSYPVDRLRYMVQAADLDLLIYADEDHRAAIGGGLPQLAVADLDAGGPTDWTPLTSPQDLAYILFTSGSTGRPKGVMVTHANVRAFVEWAVGRFALGDDDRFSNHSDLTFDLSVFDLFVCWEAGACLVPVMSPVDRTLPGRFIRDSGITVWFSVPSVLTGMIAARQVSPELLAPLRYMLFCGEALPPGPVRTLMTTAPHVKVANLYGPTEATIACSCHELGEPPAADATAVPIGWRTLGTEIFIWTNDGRLADPGEQGEILVSGSQVSPGYWRDPDQTARRFIEDPRYPGTGARCYRTGDTAVVGDDGPVFLGRQDQQVKFRGYRVELGDVEAALRAVGGITEAAVLLMEEAGNPSLTAFVRAPQATSVDDILRGLRQRVPQYMLPNRIRILDDFPRTLNGKIDRPALARAEAQAG